MKGCLRQRKARKAKVQKRKIRNDTATHLVWKGGGGGRGGRKDGQRAHL